MAKRNVTKTLTRNESLLARMQCAGVSIVWCNDWCEYTVKLAGSPEATYHTTDSQDALQTAKRMTAYKLAALEEELEQMFASPWVAASASTGA